MLPGNCSWNQVGYAYGIRWQRRPGEAAQPNPEAVPPQVRSAGSALPRGTNCRATPLLQ